jgi:hypothetical protein
MQVYNCCLRGAHVILRGPRWGPMTERPRTEANANGGREHVILSLGHRTDAHPRHRATREAQDRASGERDDHAPGNPPRD